jgi:DNA invertase Pin-like site-specific DNA recombinase
MTGSSISNVMDGYVRVSRVGGREGDAYISPKVQQEAVQRWADYKEIAIGEWLIDEDESGGTQDRPALKRGIDRALSGETAGIVSWKVDRFSRNTEGGLRDLRRLNAANARLAFVAEDIDTATVSGKLFYTLTLAISESFLANIKAGWVETRTRAIDRGVFIGMAPLGYRRGAAGVLEPDPETADVIRRAYRVAATDGLPAAARVLGDARPGQRSDTFTARRLLSSRVYLGEISHGAAGVNESAHEPLVNLGTWLKANGEQAEGRATSLEYPLTGVARCECGAALNGQRGHARADGSIPRRYRCSAVNTGAKSSAHVSLMAEPLEAIVADRVLDYLIAAELPDNGPEIADLERQLEAAGHARLAFVRDLELERDLGPDAFREGAAARSAEVERLQTAVAEASRAVSTEAWIDDAVAAARDGRIDRNDRELLGRALGRLVERVDVERGAGDLGDRVRMTFASW